MLADHWMERHGIAQAVFLPGEAKATLYTWIEPRWDEAAVLCVKRNVDRRPN
jgi:hypothetical protein